MNIAVLRRKQANIIGINFCVIVLRNLPALQTKWTKKIGGLAESRAAVILPFCCKLFTIIVIHYKRGKPDIL